jgi:2-isopropylmalate synthase
MSKKDQNIIIFDTTLRDGEQAPGCTMTIEEKIRVARQLEALKVDVIEAGFPVSSPGDFDSVSAVAREVSGPVVAGLARCVPKDIEAAAEAVKDAKKPRIHVFLATSKIHRQHKLGKARSEILKLARDGVEIAAGLTADVEFSPEDASRTEPPFLAEVVEAVIDAGATTVNIPDTVGWATPGQFGELIAGLFERVSNIDRAVISVHCHNDLGLAVANSLAAVKAGARQVECTVNGLGERAGNCSLEELVMALRVRNDFFGVSTGIQTTEIMPTSRLVSSVTGLHVQRNKAIVGENAFAHEAGIHQDGVLKNPLTYEIMRPEDVGVDRSNLVLGKHSGRHAFRARLAEMGYRLDDEQLDKAFARFKKLADLKKHVYDQDVEALVRDELTEAPERFRLVSFNVTSGSSAIPTATVRLHIEGDGDRTDAATGDGPVDAIFKAIERITGFTTKLVDYSIRAITVEKDAMGEVSLEIESGKDVQYGRGVSTDILEASLKAFLNALNKLAATRGTKKRSRRKKRKS